MDQVAALPRSDRAALFGETAAVMGIRPVIAEKDFWVCWALMHMFALSGDRPGMLFKGGTSLSKVRRRGPWRSLGDVEFATLEWVAWFNTSRLLEPLGHVPPAEYEAAYYRRQATPAALTTPN
jgi:transposase InsO family protein